MLVWKNKKQKTLYLVSPDSLVAYKDKAKESVCLSPNINLQKQRRISWTFVIITDKKSLESY